MKLLSITVPCYNSAAYMSSCIESLLPGGDEVEILIVDDGSKDDTAKIADEYARKYPDIIKAIHKPNGGHGSAVNAGLANATGEFFKVVDSDDHLKESALHEVLDFLREQHRTSTELDMLVCNYIYDKVGATKKKVINYRRSLPVGEFFTWDDVGHFLPGHYILMHAVIYRTQMLKDCGLKLPEHCFYVDNIFVFHPLPYVRNIYYLDVNLYYYFIGREDQSVNQKVMISRLDQQIRVNKIMVDYFTSKDIQKKIAKSLKLRHYMYYYLQIITTISSVLAIMANKPDTLKKKDELWRYIREKDYALYTSLKVSIFGIIVSLPGKPGRKITSFAYRAARHVFHFS